MKKLLVIIISVVAFAVQSFAQEKSHSIVLQTPASKNVELSVTTSFGFLEIIEWSKDSVKVEATIIVEGKKEKDTELAIETFNVNLEGSRTQLSIDDNSKIPDSDKKNNNIKINLKKREITFKVYAPANSNIHIIHKFGDVAVGNFGGDISVYLSHGDLSAQDFQKKFYLELNFAKAKFGNVKEAEISANHSTVKLFRAESLKLKLSFSELEMEALEGNFNADLVNAELKIEKLTGRSAELNISAKFSDVELKFAKGISVDLDLNNTSGNEKLISSGKQKVVISSKSGLNKQTRVIMGEEGSTNAQVKVIQNFGNLKITVDA